MAIRFPLGNDIFTEIRKNGDYYVDKTHFVEGLLKESFKVNLITRPRRFGKTLTMSMLEDFFDIGRDSREDFKGLAIYKNKDLRTEWMNQWPTVFLTLKSVTGNNFESAMERFRLLMSDLCKKYAFLEYSERVDTDDANFFRRVKANKESDVEACEALYLLTRMMDAHYGRKTILLIDEYDVPLAKASDGGYYDKMLDAMRALFDKALKSNEFLKFAVVTGCLKIAKESIFTGTNNFVSDTIMGGRFDELIGFTEADVHKILADAGFVSHAEEIKRWYDGYRFGSVDVYCPWDVLNHVAALQNNSARKPRGYWENTSHNNIIRSFIDRKDLWEKEHINDDFEVLLAGGYILKRVTDNLTYDMLHSSADNLWSLLYLAGYLTQAPDVEDADSDQGLVALKIPNEEIYHLYKTTVMEWFKDKIKATDRTELFDALWGQDEQTCSDILSRSIFETISYNDYKEDYYHAFVVGLLSFAGYRVKSNAEEGEGRPDIVLRDEHKGRAVIIEIKRAMTFEGMDTVCNEALKQIEDRRYAEGLETEYRTILCYGICFYKKRCLVKCSCLFRPDVL